MFANMLVDRSAQSIKSTPSMAEVNFGRNSRFDNPGNNAQRQVGFLNDIWTEQESRLL
jgi:hypothetical protein